MAVLGTGSGVALAVSILGLAPGVDPHLRVNATDVGENAFAIQAANWSTLVLVGPTWLAVSGPVLDGRVPTGPETAVIVLVAAGNSVAGAVGGGALAVRLLQERLPEAFARLRCPGMVVAQRVAGRACELPAASR